MKIIVSYCHKESLDEVRDRILETTEKYHGSRMVKYQITKPNQAEFTVKISVENTPEHLLTSIISAIASVDGIDFQL